MLHRYLLRRENIQFIKELLKFRENVLPPLLMQKVKQEGSVFSENLLSIYQTTRSNATDVCCIHSFKSENPIFQH
jgi:hypothetical protein